MTSKIRVAIISDLHCKHSSKDTVVKSTLLYSDNITESALTNPVKALKELINRESIECDIVLCPGDIADKADAQGLSSGWSYLESIQKSLKANLLIATIGNHDVNTHGPADQDPNNALKVLDINYPVPDKTLNMEFWQNGFCLYSYGETLFFIFNSCYSHFNPESGRKSTVDQTHLENIDKAINSISDKKFKFKMAMCHHHPINHGNISNPDEDLISNGDDLVKLLERHGFQVIIHGHKHEPRLSYKDSVPVFCSGSLSSTQNVNDLRIENTFHIMELLEGQNKGTIESWVLIPRRGWIKKLDTYFPCQTGFGYRGDLNDLAKRCIEWLTQNNLLLAEFSQIATQFQEINFLTPTDQELFNKALLSNNAEFTPPLPNKPRFIGLIYSKP